MTRYLYLGSLNKLINLISSFNKTYKVIIKFISKVPMNREPGRSRQQNTCEYVQLSVPETLAKCRVRAIAPTAKVLTVFHSLL